MRRRFDESHFKYFGLTKGKDAILSDLRIVRGIGTVGVAVKCVDINWNTEGEGRCMEFS